MSRENVPVLKKVVYNSENNNTETVSEIKEILARMAILYIKNKK